MLPNRKRGNQKMKKALVLLLLCVGCASAQLRKVVYVRGIYFDILRNEPWANQWDITLSTYTAPEKMCLTVFNQNPANGHTFTFTASGTTDAQPLPGTNPYKPIQVRGSDTVSHDGLAAVSGYYRNVGTVAAFAGVNIPIQEFELDSRGKGHIRLTWNTDGAAAGVPDTVTITGSAAPCGYGDHGRIASLVSANPAANTEITVTVPAYAVWRILGATATLTTGVAVPNRLVTLIVDDGVNELFRVNAAVVQAASLAYSYSFASAGSDTVVPGNVVKLPELIIKTGYRIRTLTTNLAAADDWSAMRLLVEEWVQ
jgi:hypothetical protein